jgi:hypothetical protein
MALSSALVTYHPVPVAESVLVDIGNSCTMASQSVGKYLDRTKLKSKLRAKYGASFNFNVQV